VFERFSSATSVFNCTGLGSYNLKGVEDKLLYPTKVSFLYLSLEDKYS